MARVSGEVKNRAGESVGSFGDAASFRVWRRDLRPTLGGAKPAVAIADERIVGGPDQVKALPTGVYEGSLAQLEPIPKQVRRKLRGCDLWKAI